MNWNETRRRLIDLGVPETRLPKIWQPDIDLSRLDLAGANLREADLSGANLSEADLSGADLTWADLRGANLSGADLRGANLSKANLSKAFLSEVNLFDANLRWANLSDTIGPLTGGSFGRHNAVAAGGYISIGWERHTYEEWLERYEEIGRKHGYTDEEIADYGAWIKLAVARQRRIEQPN